VASLPEIVNNPEKLLNEAGCSYSVEEEETRAL
jgi:hypothetical protein